MNNYEKIMANYEKIKNMNINEMAEHLFSLGKGCEYSYDRCIYQYDVDCPKCLCERCIEGVKKWLEKECQNE